MSQKKREKNMLFDINPAVLQSIFNNCSKKQLVVFGREIKAMLIKYPSEINDNQRQMLFKLLKHCKKLYYNK